MPKVGAENSTSFYLQEPPGIGSTRRFIAATAEVGSCPLHSHERYKALYDKLVETAKAQAAAAEEESDMEASDVEDEVPNVNSDSLPLGTTFRTIHIVQPPPPVAPQPAPNLGGASAPHNSSRGFVPRKLSTISSQDRESIPNIEEEDDAFEEDNLGPATVEAEVHAKLLSQSSGDDPLAPQLPPSGGAPSASATTTDFEWKPDTEPDEPETQALLSDEQKQATASSIKITTKSSRYRNTDV